MRFRRYLTEITKSPFKELASNMRDDLSGLYDRLKKKNWVFTDNELASIMQDELAGTRFIIGPRGGRKKYVTSGEFNANDQKMPWKIELTQGVSKFFRRFAKEEKKSVFLDVNKNAFIRELLSVMTHEIIHAFQMISSKGKAFIKPYPKNFTNVQYFKDPLEIEAWAHDAALELVRTRESEIVSLYMMMFKTQEPKVWKKFMKKVVFYVQDIKKSGIIPRPQ